MMASTQEQMLPLYSHGAHAAFIPNYNQFNPISIEHGLVFVA